MVAANRRVPPWLAFGAAVCAAPVAQAAGNSAIEAPAFLNAAMTRLAGELAARGAPAPGALHCEGAPGASLVAPDDSVFCTVEGACWTITINTREGRVQFYLFVGTPREDCRLEDLAAARAAYAAAFIECETEAGRVDAIDRVLNHPIDGSTPEKAAQAMAEAKADAQYVAAHRIDESCRIMFGYRSLSVFRNAPRDEIWLVYLKPRAASP
jgi:hypothetical protein